MWTVKCEFFKDNLLFFKFGILGKVGNNLLTGFVYPWNRKSIPSEHPTHSESRRYIENNTTILISKTKASENWTMLSWQGGKYSQNFQQRPELKFTPICFLHEIRSSFVNKKYSSKTKRWEVEPYFKIWYDKTYGLCTRPIYSYDVETTDRKVRCSFRSAASVDRHRTHAVGRTKCLLYTSASI